VRELVGVDSEEVKVGGQSERRNKTRKMKTKQLGAGVKSNTYNDG